MKKIPTMFVRDESQRGHPVINQIKPECQWVLDGEGVATRKFDGMNVKIDDGVLYKRQKPKEREYDEASYVLCDRDDPADQYLFEAFDQLVADHMASDGIYEAVGPKINGNRERFEQHVLIRVVPYDSWMTLLQLETYGRDFEGLRRYLTEARFEGVVFHHPDGRMAKIKRRDFGIPW